MARVSQILQPPRYDIYWELHGHGRGEKRLTHFTFHAPEPVKKRGSWWWIVDLCGFRMFEMVDFISDCLSLRREMYFLLRFEATMFGGKLRHSRTRPVCCIFGLLSFTITISTTFRVSQFQLWGQSPYTALSLDTCNILHTSSSCFCGMLFCLHIYLWELVRYLWMWLTSPTCHLTFGHSCPFYAHYSLVRSALDAPRIAVHAPLHGRNIWDRSLEMVLI